MAVGLMLAPLVSWLFGVSLLPSAVAARAAVAAVTLLLVWAPVSLSAGWRRMLAVSLLAAHHVGVGVAVELPMHLFVELLVGAVYVGGLGCWLLPRKGFGLLLCGTLAVGTVALGLLPPRLDPILLGAWAGVFVLGGMASELSLWVGLRVSPPGAVALVAPDAPTETERTARGALFSLAEEVSLGVGVVDDTSTVLSSASRNLVEMTAEWSSPSAWWAQIVERDRVPQLGGGPISVEMFTPGMRTRRAFRLWAIEQGGQRQIIIQDSSERIQARREAQRLAQSLDSARGEAAAAREARMRAFRSRSHHLRTPLSNLMASLELAQLSVEERASRRVISEDLKAAAASAEVLHRALNRLVEEIVSDSRDAPSEEMVDLVGLVDRELDGLQAVRTVRRSYAVAVLPMRGPRDEITSLVQAVVRRSVVACREAIFVRVESLPSGSPRVVFRIAETDAPLIVAAIRELSPRAAGLGGRIDFSDPLGPALVLPADAEERRGIESGLTWVGDGSSLDGPSHPLWQHAETDLSDDEPTHIAYSRRQAIGGRGAG